MPRSGLQGCAWWVVPPSAGCETQATVLQRRAARVQARSQQRPHLDLLSHDTAVTAAAAHNFSGSIIMPRCRCGVR